MPTYGYRCTACGHTFERVQKITDPPLTVCESCAGAVKKILYPVGISFKGSGFYVNDYSKSGPKSADSAGSETKSEAGSETKPAETKSETPSAAAAPEAKLAASAPTAS